MTTTLDCAKCGSALPQGDPGEIITCKFCNTETRVPAERPVVIIGRPPAPQKGGPAIVVALLAGVGVLVAVALVLLLRKEPPKPAPAPPTPPPPPPPVASVKPLMKPSEIGKLAELPEPAWEEIDSSEMPGRLSDFDFVGALPFAMQLAKFWAQDAAIADVALEGIGPDGKLDLSAHEGWHAEIDFVSKAMFAAQDKLREVGGKKVYTQLLFDVAQGKVKVELGRGGDVRQLGNSPPVFGCSQANVVGAFKPLGLAPRPTYTLRARYLSSVWAWSIFVDGGPSPSQTVTTESCAVKR